MHCWPSWALWWLCSIVSKNLSNSSRKCNAFGQAVIFYLVFCFFVVSSFEFWLVWKASLRSGGPHHGTSPASFLLWWDMEVKSLWLCNCAYKWYQLSAEAAWGRSWFRASCPKHETQWVCLHLSTFRSFLSSPSPSPGIQVWWVTSAVSLTEATEGKGNNYF